MKRVALWVNASESGGGEEYLNRLGQRLAQVGHDVVVVGRLPGWAGQVREVARGPKLTARRSRIVQLLLLIPSAFAARAHFHKARYDVVHVQYMREKLMLRFVTSRTQRIVWTEHGPLPAQLPRLAVKVLKWQAQRAIVVAVSQGVAESLRKVGVNATVLPNPLPPRGSSLPQTNESNTAVMYAGRLHQHKRVDLLLAAAELLPDRRFVIVGTGPQERRLRLAAGSNVSFLGHRSDVLDLMSTASVLVLPSGCQAREGSPMALLEGRGLGIAVLVASDSHAAPEARELGATIFEPTPASLASAIESAEGWRIPLSTEIRRERSEERWFERHLRAFGLEQRDAL